MRPPGAGLQGQASNYSMLAAALKRRGGERWRKGGAGHHQVGDEKMIEREPLVTHRKRRDAVKTGVDLRLPEKHGSHLLTVHAAAGV